MGGGGGSQKSTTTTSIDPRIAPYVTYGLEEAKRLYQGAGPQYFQGQTYVSPSEATQQSLQMARERALGGSPLIKAAQQEQLDTIAGRGVNPFLAGALEQTNRIAADEYLRNIQALQSQASSAGRYGSAAAGQQQGQAQDIFARNLQEAAGRLAYQSAEAERGRQVQASQFAPTMAATDYADIQRLLQAGQAQEAYGQQAIQGQLAAQDLPMQRLQQAANVFYGAPLETKTTATPEGGK